MICNGLWGRQVHLVEIKTKGKLRLVFCCFLNALFTKGRDCSFNIWLQEVDFGKLKQCQKEGRGSVIFGFSVFTFLHLNLLSSSISRSSPTRHPFPPSCCFHVSHFGKVVSFQVGEAMKMAPEFTLHHKVSVKLKGLAFNVSFW